jgi:hypothetical protein
MKPALLLVDLQGDYLGATGLQPAADILVSRATALLNGCRERQIPVIHIWTTVRRDNDRRLPHWKKANRWHCVAGTDGHKTPAPLQPIQNETTINKSGFDGFAGGELDAAQKKQIAIPSFLPEFICPPASAPSPPKVWNAACKFSLPTMPLPATTRFTPPPRAAGWPNAALNLFPRTKFCRGWTETRRQN